jgi:undecaprenyl-phosphate 4-deoxy-4-formamido-L-arabinose transferase
MLGKPRDLYLSSFKAMSRFAIEQVTRYTGPYPYVDGLILRATRNYTTVLCQHEARNEGKSGYTLRKLVALWLNMFTTFSVLPLRIASLLGVLVACGGVLLAAFFVLEKLVYPETERGWASLMVTLLIVSGIQLMVLGLIGEYLGRLYLQSSGRPQFVIRDASHVHGKPVGQQHEGVRR